MSVELGRPVPCPHEVGVLDDVAKSRAKIQVMVYDENRIRGGISSYVRRNNRKIDDEGKDEHGEDYVGNLLPLYSHRYKTIVGHLGRRNIFIKSDLAEVSVDDLQNLKIAMGIRGSYIKAMRDLAIAEVNQAPKVS